MTDRMPDVLQLAQSPGTHAFLASLAEANPKKFKEFVPLMQENERNVNMSAENMYRVIEKCWQGIAVETDFQKLNYMDTKVLALLASGTQDRAEVSIQYSIGEDSQLLRGYQDINPLENKAIKTDDLLDKIFQAWLVSKGWATDEKGIVRIHNKDGKLGEAVPKVDIQTAIIDEKTGIKAKAGQLAPMLAITLSSSEPESPKVTATSFSG